MYTSLAAHFDLMMVQINGRNPVKSIINETTVFMKKTLWAGDGALKRNGKVNTQN
jgi:hypothetical protein